MSTYGKYDQALARESGIDFKHYVNKFRQAGNETGIYSDVALLLYRVASDNSVNHILEFGSGMSTCVLNKAALDHSKKLSSMEHMRKWYDITSKCLGSLGLSPNAFVCTDSLHANFVKVDTEVDVVFIDGPIAHNTTGDVGNPTVGRTQACGLYGEWLKNAVLIFDDAQALPEVPEWLRSYGRGEETEVWFNPTGRGDRHELISFPTLDHPLRAVVESCNL